MAAVLGFTFLLPLVALGQRPGIPKSEDMRLYLGKTLPSPYPLLFTRFSTNIFRL